ncbi:MAG TPA: sigma-54 dependent transcriptional regulator [Steroidobacteraceae bacterium]|jgi:two-component system response regulator PilR (NtrC family)|nr:sigma-54 dependent transcriptional regulator [Steroidobacteraceae bacterium]
MTQPVVLIVDDEPDLIELVSLTLSRMNLESEGAKDLASARARLIARRYDLCLTDMRLPDGDGLSLVEWIQKNQSELPVAVITAHGNVESAVRALKLGAFDFVSKPLDLGALRKLVGSAIKLGDMTATGVIPSRTASAALGARSSRLLGGSQVMHSLRELVTRVARSQAPVHITGESGTGKELAARLIHESGARADGPFVAVNCGAIPSELMESELFGHKRGSFTGAVADKRGLVQSAEGGTLFLDEVADLPLHMQVKLLRVIQEKTVRPIGEQREQPVDVRVLSATHRNLTELVALGRFREDLYYRINVIDIRVPALREHAEDIPELADVLLQKLAKRIGAQFPHLSLDARQALQRYSFPGNVRELENILERAVALSVSGVIGITDLQLRSALPAAVPSTGEDVTGLGSEFTASSESGPTGVGPTAPTSVGNTGGALGDQLQCIERDAIVRALSQTRYNKTAAAKLLGMSFRALRYRVKKLGIE